MLHERRRAMEVEVWTDPGLVAQRGAALIAEAARATVAARG
jgi:hypothetical protein